MSFRNQLIEEDGSYSTNQIVNIDEDQVRLNHIVIIIFSWQLTCKDFH
jgi:hypothetical protein